MTKNERKVRKRDAKQASGIVAVGSIIGLTICFLAAIYEKTQIPIFLYAIFGGGILGTDNIVRLIRAIFKVNGSD